MMEQAAALLRAKSANGSGYFLLAPALLFLVGFFVLPIMSTLIGSVQNDAGFSLEHYIWILQRPVYLRVLLITFEIATEVTILCLILAYPLAYVLSRAKGRTAAVLILLVLIPFFTDVLVRTYAWMVILTPGGVLNRTFNAIGIPYIQMMYNRSGVLIGMSYAMLPYMVLTLYSGMKAIDENLLRAANSLGAPGWRVFLRIFLPLSLPSVTAGSLMVFILSLGYFVTPRLMGGASDQMIATVIQEQIEGSLNWDVANALSAILLTATLLIFFGFARFVGLERLFTSKLAQ